MPAPPDWVKDAVFYQIFPDRFARGLDLPKPANLEPWHAAPTSRGFKGGDLMGVVERLDYLTDLGITALYLNPIFESSANHRYHTTDYMQVDPILGGNDALRALLDAAHGRGMRVVLDGVFNHTGRGFFQFNHILENGPASPYVDWFEVQDWPLHPYDAQKPANYSAWWEDRELPKLNIRNPAVRQFLLAVAQHWIAFGADGWRLDVPEEIDDRAFWQAFRRRVKEADPQAYLVGEIWRHAPDWLRGDRFDGLMNYPFSRACLSFMGGPALDTSFRPGGFEIQAGGAHRFARLVDDMLSIYDWESTLVQLNSLDSHDTARFLTMVQGDARRLKLALLCQMTFPGAPCLYYGDEIGMQGGEEPASRGAFPWDPAVWDQDLLAYTRRCIQLRHRHPSLRRGRFHRLYAQDGAYAFSRHWEGEQLLVALNAAEESRRLNLSLHEPVARAVDVWGGELLPVDGGRLQGLDLAPLSGRVLKAENA